MTRTPCRIAAVLILLAATTATAQVVRQLTDDKTSGVGLGAMDDAGTVVYTAGSADPLGSNPDHSPEVFLFDPVTGTPTQVTDNPGGTTAAVSVSDDGL